jgi:hypothetical protein
VARRPALGPAQRAIASVSPPVSDRRVDAQLGDPMSFGDDRAVWVEASGWRPRERFRLRVMFELMIASAMPDLR